MNNFGFSSISVSGALSYQGVWNAATNTPLLASGIGTTGEYYIVGTAGTTNLDGITDWQLGDWAIFSGSTWQKIDNSDSVTGNGASNELTYWTSPSAIASLNTTTYPDLTEISYVKGVTSDIQTQLNGKVATLRTISTSSPLSGGGDLSTNRTLSISQATTSTDGYLSSTDWNTFNNKQNVAPNVQSVISSATVTPTSTNDLVVITAQAAALLLANPTGSPNQGQNLMIRIKDNGTAIAISYDTQYRAIGVTLPTTTVINKTLYLGLVYNSTDTKWDVIGVAQEA